MVPLMYRRPSYWAANNYPLRGSKGTDFQGGVRVAAFVTGGLLPASVRGTTLSARQRIHVADWYSTFCFLAKVPADDESAAVAAGDIPPIDSVNVWPLLSGTNATSPRDEVAISSATIIVGDFKLIYNSAPWGGFFQATWFPACNPTRNTSKSPNCHLGLWTGPEWPQHNCAAGDNRVCPHECSAASNCNVSIGSGADKYFLFNIETDPRELHDLSEDPQYSTVLQMLVARRALAADSHFQTTDSGMVYSECAPSWAANLQAHKNFAAPSCNVATPKAPRS